MSKVIRGFSRAFFEQRHGDKGRCRSVEFHILRVGNDFCHRPSRAFNLQPGDKMTQKQPELTVPVVDSGGDILRSMKESSVWNRQLVVLWYFGTFYH